MMGQYKHYANNTIKTSNIKIYFLRDDNDADRW